MSFWKCLQDAVCDKLGMTSAEGYFIFGVVCNLSSVIVNMYRSTCKHTLIIPLNINMASWITKQATDSLNWQLGFSSQWESLLFRVFLNSFDFHQKAPQITKFEILMANFKLWALTILGFYQNIFHFRIFISKANLLVFSKISLLIHLILAFLAGITFLIFWLKSSFVLITQI